MATYYAKQNQTFTSKPVGQVEIDWGYFSSNSKFVYLPQVSVMPNLLTGSFDLSLGTATIEKDYLLTSVDTVSTPITIDSSNWSYVLDVTLNKSGLNNICDVAESPGNSTHDRYVYIDASNQLVVGIYDGATKTATSTSTFTTGDRLYIVVTCDGSSLKLFVNGRLEASTAVSNTGFTGYTTPEFIHGRSTSPNGGFGANYYRLSAMVGRAYSDGLATFLSRNPYAFLKPAANEYYLVTYTATQAVDGVYYLKDYGVPTSKPVGQNVEIDWQHPLAATLQDCFFNNGSGVVKNLGRGNWPDIDTDPTSYVNGPEGPTSVHDDMPISTGLTPVTVPFTQHARIVKDVSFTGAGRAFGYHSTAGDDLSLTIGGYSHYWRVRYNYGTQVTLSVDGGVDPSDPNSIVQDLILVARSASDFDLYLFVDGKLQDSTTSTGVTIGGFSTYNWFTFGGANRGVSIGSHFAKAFTADEAASLARNPYAFLKPAAPQYFPLGAANDAGGTDALTATSVESASTVSSNTLTQVHSLTATSVESASTVSSPTLAEGSHVLTATSVESASTVSTNTLTQEHALTATSVESASTVSTPTLTSVAGTDVLTAVSVESASTVNTPTLGQTHVFTATSVETTTEVTTSSLTQVHILAANDVEAASTLSAVAIDRAELTSSEVATRFVSNANYYRVVSDANIYRVDN